MALTFLFASTANVIEAKNKSESSLGPILASIHALLEDQVFSRW